MLSQLWWSFENVASQTCLWNFFLTLSLIGLINGTMSILTNRQVVLIKEVQLGQQNSEVQNWLFSIDSYSFNISTLHPCNWKWSFSDDWYVSICWITFIEVVRYIIKAILRDVMGEEKFSFSHLVIIQLRNDPCCHLILSPQCIHAEYFA